MNRQLKIENILDSISVTHNFPNPEVIFLNTSDVLEGKILHNNYSRVSELKGQAKKTIQKDDILFSEIRPKNKRYAYVSVNNPEEYVVSTKLMVLRNKNKEVLTKYIYYYLTYQGTLNYLQMRAENRIGSFPQITFDILKPILVDIPDVRTQNLIVNLIFNIDSIIQLNNKINAELEAMAKLIYDYWFVQFDFPDQNGKPYKSSGGTMIYNEELKREIPKDWEVKKLNQIADITMGQSPPGTSYNTSGDGSVFFQGSTEFGPRHPVAEQYTTSPKRFAKKSDILLSVRAPVGTMNIADRDCCIGRGLAALRSKRGSQAYLYEVMQYFKQVFERQNSGGTTFGSITKDGLYNLKVTYPGDSLVSNFEQIIGPVYSMQNTNGEENQKLTELRDWLLPMLMNGQVKLN